MYEQTNLDLHLYMFLYLCPCFVADRPIASIAFHAEGELLAVAAGHKVFIPTCQIGLGS